MNAHFYDNMPDLKEHWEQIKGMFTEIQVPAKTTLLR